MLLTNGPQDIRRPEAILRVNLTMVGYPALPITEQGQVGIEAEREELMAPHNLVPNIFSKVSQVYPQKYLIMSKSLGFLWPFMAFSVVFHVFSWLSPVSSVVTRTKRFLFASGWRNLRGWSPATLTV